MGVHQDGGRQQGRGRSRGRVGAPADEQGGGRAAKDPFTRFFAKLSANPQVPLLDSVVPVKVAILYYKQLQAAFAGKTTPLQAMQNVDKGSSR